eukprot:5107670-Amphidinium_carterae.1
MKEDWEFSPDWWVYIENEVTIAAESRPFISDAWCWCNEIGSGVLDQNMPKGLCKGPVDGANYESQSACEIAA